MVEKYGMSDGEKLGLVPETRGSIFLLFMIKYLYYK